MQIESDIIEKGIVSRMTDLLEEKLTLLRAPKMTSPTSIMSVSSTLKAPVQMPLPIQTATAKPPIEYLIQQALLNKDQASLWAYSAQYTAQILRKN